MFYIHFIYIGLSLNTPYYFDKNIHNFGNIGFGGFIHSNLAPLATKYIDNIRYNGINIRKEIMTKYKDKSILDLCCGTGMSTMPYSTGIDTSKEMINVARNYNKHKHSKFYIANAENYTPESDKSFDIVSCMFALHEMPRSAQIKVIQNAINIANKEVVIVDISPDYTPSNLMLSGEPYLPEYLKNIEFILKDFEYNNYINNHVSVWKVKVS
tara:strand:- start:2792 stop:3427 length:636 start_codon:yes stop_codon:yes gene_type:complete